MSVYLAAKFRVLAHKEAVFPPIGRKICRLIEERAGWELVAALTSLSGTQRECLHLWRLPDANALANLSSQIQEQDTEAINDFSACIDAEEFQLLSELDYHPGSG